MHVRIHGDIIDLERAIASGKLGDISMVTEGTGNRTVRFNPTSGSNSPASASKRPPSDGSHTPLLVAGQSNLEPVTAAPDGDKNDADEMRTQIRKLCEGMQLRLIIETPGAIVRTSGETKGRKVVQWIFDPNIDPAFLFEPPELYVEYK